MTNNNVLTQAKERKRSVHLYWVTTPDHDEDWFIFAKNSRSAESLHVEYEGYSPGDATAQMILHDVDYNDHVPCHAHEPELERLGFEIVQTGDPFLRQVKYQGRTFTEGSMQSDVMRAHDDAFEAAGKGRPNRTKRTETRDSAQ